MKLNVRNMVCNHCISALNGALVQLDYVVTDAGLGYAEISDEALSDADMAKIRDALSGIGFELITDPNRQLVEAVKHEVLRHINNVDPCRHNLSHCIAEATGQDYKHVSRLFAAVEGRTIEKFYVSAKIEKVKELLSYGDISINEIAYRLGYSSVAYLSRQFKQETGMTLIQYQKSGHARLPLTDI